MMSPSLATSHFAEPSAIASANNTGSSQADQVFDKMPANFQRVESLALIDKNITDVEPVEGIEIPQIGNATSVEADLVHEPSSITTGQVFNESSHQIESSVHEVDTVFDLVESNLEGLQMPLQVTRVISKPTWCSKIAYYDDTHSRKSVDEENECLETNSHLAFDESLQRKIFHLQGQFANLKLVVIGNSVFHEILNSDFDVVRGVNIRNLTVCDSMTDCVPTCYWFDTGQHVFQSSRFVFKHKKYDDHLSVMELDKNGYCPVFGAQGDDVLFLPLYAQIFIAAGMVQKQLGKALFAIGSSKILASHIQTMESSNSKVDQAFNAMSNVACKVFNAMSTSLLVGVLIEIVKEKQNYFLSSFGGRESIMPTAHSTRAPPMRYFVANSLYNDFSGQKTILMASDDLCADIIFMKTPRIEDLYHDKQFLENKVDFSRSEIQFVGVKNDIQQVKFNEVKRHAEHLFAFYLGVNLFMVKLAEMVLVNCVWDPVSSLLTIYNWDFSAASSDLDRDKFIISTLRHSYNWVGTGQGRKFSGFLLSKSRENVMEEKIQGVLHEFVESYSKQSPNTPVNGVVKLLCAMFGLVHKSRTVLRHIHFSLGQFLHCDDFRFDSVLNHFLISLCVQTVQTQHPRPTPKPSFPALLLEFLAQVAQPVESPKKLDLCELVKVDRDDSNTSAHLLTAHFRNNTNATVSLVAMLEEWKVIKLKTAYMVIFQVVHPIVRTLYGQIAMVELAARRTFHQALVAMERYGGERASKIIHQSFKVQKQSENDGVNSRILKAANRIMILFLGVFICTSQGIYNTPSCRMKLLDMNLEDKVLFWGGSIVVNHIGDTSLADVDTHINCLLLWEHKGMVE